MDITRLSSFEKFVESGSPERPLETIPSDCRRCLQATHHPPRIRTPPRPSHVREPPRGQRHPCPIYLRPSSIFVTLAIAVTPARSDCELVICMGFK